jgi:tetratricopeptide (TPR) repeat protein
VAKKIVKGKPAVKSQPSGDKPKPVENMQGASPKTKSPALIYSLYLPYLVICLFTTAIYFNTLWDRYAIDDMVVLTENKFTRMGCAGIRDIMTHDTNIAHYGEKNSKELSGGRYRPLSIVTMAIEVGFFGMDPKVSHGINILLFTLTCLLLYHILKLLLPGKKDTPFYLSIPFIATMLFAGHPIHTEVVANIKGRDEIMGLLFSLLALFAALKYAKAQKIVHLLWGSVAFFLALLSKENAITFIAVIPLTYFFFTRAAVKDYMLAVGLYLIPVILFLYLRATYTEAGIAAEVPEILNNPFAYLPKNMDGFLQRYATIIMTFILYFKLLIFPHPLTIDYYYNQVPFIGIGNPIFLLSVLVNGGLLLYAIIGLRKKSLPSYAILFYFITFSIVSNLFFTVSMLMNERLIYMSSIGFCLLVAWLIAKAKDRFNLPVTIVTGVLLIVLFLYSAKTISRNRVWSDNLTLFLTDAKTSTNSAKVNSSAGGNLAKMADENFDSLRRSGRLQRVADLLEMNVNVAEVADSTLKREFLSRSVKYLDRSLAIYPHYYDALYNMACVQFENNNLEPAKDNYKKALAIRPDEFDCINNLAITYMNLKMDDSALIWFTKVLKIKPDAEATNFYTGITYGRLGHIDMAIEYFSKAIKCNPNVATYYENLGIAYGLNNRPDDAIRVSEQCLKKFPGYIPALNILAFSYTRKGDVQKANEYNARIAQLTGRK